MYRSRSTSDEEALQGYSSTAAANKQQLQNRQNSGNCRINPVTEQKLRDEDESEHQNERTCEEAHLHFGHKLHILLLQFHYQKASSEWRLQVAVHADNCFLSFSLSLSTESFYLLPCNISCISSRSSPTTNVLLLLLEIDSNYIVDAHYIEFSAVRLQLQGERHQRRRDDMMMQQRIITPSSALKRICR